jgi:uncharacterized protein
VAAPRTTTQAQTTAAAAAVANPGPLGLCGFALTTFVLSMVNNGVLKEADLGAVIGLALFYGGLAQLLAGMWEFRAGNTFGATAFASYGAFWLSFAALLVPGLGNSALKPSNTGLGYYLLGWAIFTGIMAVGSLRTNGATAAVFVLLFLTFLLLAIGKFSNGTATTDNGITHFGGWVGVLTAIAAWYAAMAGILSSVSGSRIALPVYPLA